MKRRGDTTKRSKGAKNVLRDVKNLISLLLLLAACSSSLLAQININGFYNQTFLSAKHTCSKIFFTDFNGDNIKDAVLINSGNKNFGIFRSGAKGYRPYQEKFFYFNISGIKEFMKRPDGSVVYVFVSRAERVAGLASFTPYGTLKLLNRIRFDSYPDKVEVDDFNGDGKNEALIFGEAFNGLVVLEEKGLVLHPIVMDEQNIFDHTILTDLNYDGFTDIAAHNGINNSLVFYINDEQGGFEPERTLMLDDDIECLKAADLNSDYFTDIAYINGGGIEVMYGDSVSSYQEKTVLINRSERVTDFVLNDFNTDGLVDMAYSTSQGGIFIRYNNNGSLSQQICYGECDKVLDIYSYKTATSVTLAALAENGLTITRKNIRLNEQTSLKTGCTPHLMKYTVYPENFIRELAVIDTTENKFAVMLYGSNKFDWYEEFNLAMPYKNIVAFRTPDRREYYLYNTGGRIIEAVRTYGTETIRTQIYTYAGLLDVGVSRDITPKPVALVNEGGKLGIMEFGRRENKFIPAFRKDLMEKVIDARFSASDSVEIYAWTSRNGILSLNRLNVKGSFGISDNLLSMPHDTTYAPFVRKIEDPINTCIFASTGGKEPILYYTAGGKAIKITGKAASRFSDALRNGKVVKWHKGKLSFLIYNGGNVIDLVRLDMATGKIIPIKSIESGKVNAYFSTVIDNTDYLFFVTEGTSLIRIKKIE